MQRVSEHWAAVDDALPPESPLVLLREVDRQSFEELMEGLTGLRNAVTGRELRVRLARSVYERRKAIVHRWLRRIRGWMRGTMQGTDWMDLAQPVPGRGESYQHWWAAGTDALGMWEVMGENPPPSPVDWPLDMPDGGTAAQFAEAMKEMETAFWAIRRMEVKLRIARSRLWRAQERATALLMAYGHGVRAWLEQTDALVRSIPELWPKHQRRKKAA